MAGFPLMAIGAGIGQGAEAIQRQRAEALRQALTMQALQKYQQQQGDEALLGQALAGGQLSDLFGGGRIPASSPLGAGGTGLPGVAPQPQAPAPMGGGAPVLTPAGPTPPSMMLPQDRPPNVSLTPEQQDALSNTKHDLSRGEAEALYDAAGIDSGVRGGSGTPHDRSASAKPTRPIIPEEEADRLRDQGVLQGPAGNTPAPAADAGAHAAPITNPTLQSLLGPHIQLDKVASALKAARPDADPGTIWRATSLLYEMLEKGNVAQQNTAIRAYSALLAQGRLEESTRSHQATEGDRAAARQQRAEIATGEVGGKPTVGAQRVQVSKDAMAQRATQFQQRRADTKAKADAAQARGDTRQAYLILKAHLDFVRSELGSIRGNMPAGKERDKQIKDLQDDANETQKRMNNLPGAAGQSP